MGVQTGSCAGGQALGSHAIEAREIYTCSARGVHGQLEVEDKAHSLQPAAKAAVVDLVVSAATAAAADFAVVFFVFFVIVIIIYAVHFFGFQYAGRGVVRDIFVDNMRPNSRVAAARHWNRCQTT